MWQCSRRLLASSLPTSVCTKEIWLSDTSRGLTHWFEVIGRIVQGLVILQENVYNTNEKGITLSMLGSVKALVKGFTLSIGSTYQLEGPIGLDLELLKKGPSDLLEPAPEGPSFRASLGCTAL